MLPCDGRAVCKSEGDPAPSALEQLLRALAVVTMLMTVPQVISVWQHGGQGVALWSWVTYLVSSTAWLVYGVQKRDVTIWAVCVGWIILDAAIIAGILVNK